MYFARRTATGLYVPTQTDPYKDYFLFDDFNVADGVSTINSSPNGGLLHWVTSLPGTGNGTIVGSPLNSCLTPPVCMLCANESTGIVEWVSASPSSDTFFIGDQFSEITYSSYISSGSPAGTFGPSVGLCARASGSTVVNAQQGYYGFLDNKTGTAQLGVFFFNSVTVQYFSFATGGGLSLTSGDVIKLTATGTNPITLTLFQNGTSVVTVTSTFPVASINRLYSTGAPGLMWSGGSDVNPGTCTGIYGSRTFCKTWRGGSLSPAPPAFQDFRGSGYWYPTAPVGAI